MNQTQRLERPGAHESAVTGNHIYEKTSHRDSDDPRRLGRYVFLEELGRKNPGALYRYHQEWVECLARGAEAEAAKARG